MNFSITKNGQQLSSKLYNWDASTRTLSTLESGLVLDFSGIDGVTFDTGHNCTFNTGDNCTFDTGWDCTFDTGWDCTFDTGPDCTFKTGPNCTFKTGDNCTFNTGSDCTFNTGDNCTFDTGPDCTFNTGWDCTFNTGDNCVAIPYDVAGITELNSKQVIQFNKNGIAGHTVIPQTKTITIAGEDIEISEDSFQALKTQLNT
jgi:uncharacterized cupin superfamily protein